jgi:hypothetical protein
VLAIEEMREAFYGELDSNLAEMVEPDQIDLWLNQARAHTRYEHPTTAVLAWSKGNLLVDLPDDFCSLDEIVPSGGASLPTFRVWNGKLRITDPNGAPSDGTATIFYGAIPPKVTGSAKSVMPEVIDQACVSWALSRFFRRLASSRSDYRRYSTIAQGNAADIGQLLTESDRHHGDFLERVDAWRIAEPVSFFGG